MVEGSRLSVCAMCVIQLENKPSVANELLEEVPSVENEWEPISKVSSCNLATRGPLEDREVPI